MYKKTTSFIRSLFPNQEHVPLHAPCFVGNEKKYLEECINSTYVSSVGSFVNRFEEDMARFTGARRAVVCDNGTNALHLALILAGVEKDDEVITQPLTFVATCNAISYCGAHPVLVDIELENMCLCPDALESWIRCNTERRGDELWNRMTGRRVKACVPMHTFGHPAMLDELVEICSYYKLELIEDASQSLGSYYKGRHTGTFGKAGVLSFNGNKILTTGGGGMLLFNDEKLADRAKHLSTQAKVPHDWEFYHDEIGYNYRMPNINAALGCAQLENLPLFLEKKRELAALYSDFFEPLNAHFISEQDGARSNYWLNAILMPSRRERDEMLEYTNSHGVMTRPAWELMSRLPMYATTGDDTKFQNAVSLTDRLVNIPSSVRL